MMFRLIIFIFYSYLKSSLINHLNYINGVNGWYFLKYANAGLNLIFLFCNSFMVLNVEKLTEVFGIFDQFILFSFSVFFSWIVFPFVDYLNINGFYRLLTKSFRLIWSKPAVYQFKMFQVETVDWLINNWYFRLRQLIDWLMIDISGWDSWLID